MNLPFLRRTRSRGQTLVEFALILPLFCLIVFGLFDIGRAVYAYNTVSNAARAAARVAIVNQDPVAIRDEAKRMGVGLGLADGDITLGACDELDCQYSVTVDYDYFAVTPIVGNIFKPTITSTASMPLEFENP